MKAIDAPAMATKAGSRTDAAMMALPQVSGVRGLGLLLAVELRGVNAQVAAAKCLEDGLVVNGITPTAIRLAPPLIIGEEHIAEAASILGPILDELEGKP